MRLTIRILILFLFFSNTIFAQKWETGIGVGLMHYKGDLSPRLRPLDGRPGTNLFLRLNKDRIMSFSFNAEAGRLRTNETKSQDKFQQLRGFSFKSNIINANVRAEYNFLNFRVNQANYISNWSPYTYFGLGGLFRQSIVLKANVTANPIPTDFDPKKNKFAVAIPFGVGFKKKWRGPWNYGAEFGSYKFFGLGLDRGTINDKPLKRSGVFRYDYLDGLGPTATNASDRLQTFDKDLGDWYLYTRFYISYVFYKVACPK